MTTFIGYSSVGRSKNFTMTDMDLVKRDLLNAFNIPVGSLPGLPSYGTNLAAFIFEPQTQETEAAVYREVQRVAGLDPRLYINSIQLFPWSNGMLLQLEITIVPSNVTEMLNIFFNQDSRSATYVQAG